MKNTKEYKLLYLVAIISVITITTIGSTYAYITARTNSSDNSVNTKSTSYLINMEITSIFPNYSFIPMNDEYIFKAIKNNCLDKYNRGVCQAYYIRVFDYSETLDYISGYMDVTTDNMTNISYMMFEESNTYDENNCIEIDEKYYCKKINATPIGEGKKLSLGEPYSVLNQPEKKLILAIWLSNLNKRQNDEDIGNFNATITIEAGSGGEIKGSIANAMIIDNEGDGNNGG